MAATPPPGGNGRARDSNAFDRLDGRLDLDRLDLDRLETETDLEGRLHDLDVLGSDGRPTMAERVHDLLEERQVLPWMRRHRAATALVGALVAASLVAGGLWVGTRPAPLPAEAYVTVTNEGNEAARLVMDTTTGHVTAITQLVLVTSSEPPGVTVTTLGVRGPGLGRTSSRVPDAFTAAPTTGAVTAEIDCVTREATDAVVRATAADYRVLLRRTVESTGEVRESEVPLAGAEEWLTDVRRSCVQIAADRDLLVRDVQATPVAGNVAADLLVLVRNRSTRPWNDLRVSVLASPTVVSAGPAPDLAGGAEAWVHARLWPDDCGNPVARLADGLLMRAALDSGGPVTESRQPTFRLPLGADALDSAAHAIAVGCAGPRPTLRIESAAVVGSDDSDSGGTIEIVAAVSAPDVGIVEIDAGLPTVSGTVSAIRNPAFVVDGVARMQLAWVLPPCFELLATGGPHVGVRLVGESVRRPFVLRLHGPVLERVLAQVCGPTVGTVAR